MINLKLNNVKLQPLERRVLKLLSDHPARGLNKYDFSSHGIDGHIAQSICRLKKAGAFFTKETLPTFDINGNRRTGIAHYKLVGWLWG